MLQICTTPEVYSTLPTGDSGFCFRFARQDDEHAPIWDADGPYCQTCWQVTPRNQAPTPAPEPEPEPEPELEAG